jgi:hypothetical protein
MSYAHRIATLRSAQTIPAITEKITEISKLIPKLSSFDWPSMKRTDRKTTGTPTAYKVAPAALKKDVTGPSGLISRRPINRKMAIVVSCHKLALGSANPRQRTVAATAS